jgi:hypothetical protein
MQMVLELIVTWRPVVSISCRDVLAETEWLGMQGTPHLSRGLENKGTRPTLGFGRVLFTEFHLKSVEILTGKIYFIKTIKLSVY